jgi:hypothetical protein
MRGDGRIPTDGQDIHQAINSSRPEDRKKVDRNTRKSLPLSDVVIENHLLEKETIGIYPLLPDETCWFLAVDFDKKTWDTLARKNERSSQARK